MAFIRATSPHRELLRGYSNVAEGSLNEGRKIYSSVMNFHRKIHFVPLFFFFPPSFFSASFCFRSSFRAAFFFFFYDSLFRLTFDYVTSSLQFDSLPSSFPRYLTLLCNYRHLLYREFPLILYYKSELFNIVFLLVILIKFQVTILKSYWMIYIFSYF